MLPVCTSTHTRTQVKCTGTIRRTRTRCKFLARSLLDPCGILAASLRAETFLMGNSAEYKENLGNEQWEKKWFVKTFEFPRTCKLVYGKLSVRSDPTRIPQASPKYPARRVHILPFSAGLKFHLGSLPNSSASYRIGPATYPLRTSPRAP